MTIQKAVFTYKTHNETSIVLPLYDFKKEAYIEGGERTFRKTLLGAMHPGVSLVLGKVPTQTELNNDEKEIKKYVEKLKKGVDISGVNHRLDISGGGRTHGICILTEEGTNIGETYFGKGNSMGSINYGSILLTALRNIISAKVNVLIVDDEVPEIRRTGLGDSHGKATPEVLRALSNGVLGEGNDNTPLQVRIGFPNEFLFKGTIIGFENGIIPEEILSKYGVDERNWDLILPLSGIKANKPVEGKGFRKKLCYMGTVHYAEKREATGSQQLWMWYTPKAIKKDIVLGLTRKCQELKTAIENRESLGEVFKEVDDIKADIGHSGEVDPDNWESNSDTYSSSAAGEELNGEDWSDPLLELLKADKKGTLLEHPYTNTKIAQKLARRWRRYALNTHINLESYMMLPDDSIGRGEFVCGTLRPGYYLSFRNPILHYGSVKLLKNVHKGEYKHYMNHTAVYMSHDTAADMQGDFDGDFVTMMPLTHSQQIFAAKCMDAAIDPSFGQDMFNEYINDELQLKEDDLQHIIFETAFFEYLWGDEPTIKKPGKVKIQGKIEEVFYRSMDSQTGIISNLIQHSKSNGTFNIEVSLPKFDERTGEELGGNYKVTILQFLSQEMQYAVDRLKNELYHNMKGIEICRQVIEGGRKPSWIEKGAYKSKDAYKKFTIPLGTLEKVDNKWVEVSTDTFPQDVVSLTISVVNEYWSEWKETDMHVSSFKDFFPNKMYDGPMVGNARRLHLWYGSSMANASKISNIDEQKKAMRTVRDSADDRIKYRRELSSTLLSYDLSQDDLRKIYEGDAETTHKYVGDIVPSDNIGLPTTERGVWKDEEGTYHVITGREYAAALWFVSHTTGANVNAIAGSVFKMYTDEIIKRLSEEDELKSSIWFSGQHQQLGDIIFADSDAVKTGERFDEKAPNPAKKEGTPTAFLPSRVDKKGNLLPTDSTSGTILPNEVDMKVIYDGERLNDRTGGKKYKIFIRTSEAKPFMELGIIGSGKKVPPLDTVIKAKLYTNKLTANAEPLQLMKGDNRFRTKGGIFTWQ